LETEEGGTPFRSENPRPHLPRRVVPHMLPMAALKVGYPVTYLVQVVSDNGSLQDLWSHADA
jgi:hypothetical protein